MMMMWRKNHYLLMFDRDGDDYHLFFLICLFPR
jgi:hypothetical protein